MVLKGRHEFWKERRRINRKICPADLVYLTQDLRGSRLI